MEFFQLINFVNLQPPSVVLLTVTPEILQISCVILIFSIKVFICFILPTDNYEFIIGFPKRFFEIAPFKKLLRLSPYSTRLLKNYQFKH